ncbi:hypothetical protein [Roseivivax sp. THAF40]|uniref:hypothetical protein n=1 Tax=Roseivivax sp. THAF40 TaxID=2587858 RepID=UPI001562763A|nr:hypothetical protein [Roseivivax sp. THAF40]
MIEWRFLAGIPFIFQSPCVLAEAIFADRTCDMAKAFDWKKTDKPESLIGLSYIIRSPIPHEQTGCPQISR